ncbi:hypothetical protein NPIL_217931 [Nephila pilipes]|uniref:Uncharacterized protein n=1 Tax=Nephila pilipes TaxID=299642 RepID=A0A8X6P2I7_NEPPI|nr:hypothetical protein NPIL_217931 [Nephila pilipes]
MDVLKSFRGRSESLYGDHSMPLDFGSLACNAASCPFSEVFRNGWPNKAVLDETLCGTNAWMGESKILQSEVSLIVKPDKERTTADESKCATSPAYIRGTKSGTGVA